MAKGNGAERQKRYRANKKHGLKILKVAVPVGWESSTFRLNDTEHPTCLVPCPPPLVPTPNGKEILLSALRRKRGIRKLLKGDLAGAAIGGTIGCGASTGMFGSEPC